jgi:hypothetical protein
MTTKTRFLGRKPEDFAKKYKKVALLRHSTLYYYSMALIVNLIAVTGTSFEATGGINACQPPRQNMGKRGR